MALLASERKILWLGSAIAVAHILIGGYVVGGWAATFGIAGQRSAWVGGAGVNLLASIVLFFGLGGRSLASRAYLQPESKSSRELLVGLDRSTGTPLFDIIGLFVISAVVPAAVAFAAFDLVIDRPAWQEVFLRIGAVVFWLGGASIGWILILGQVRLARELQSLER